MTDAKKKESTATTEDVNVKAESDARAEEFEPTIEEAILASGLHRQFGL